VVLGVGAGWMREEYDALGVEFRTRGRRMDEGIEVLRRCWTGEMFEFHGEFFDLERLVVRPAPPEPIPVWVGGASEPALRRTARVADGWIGAGGSADELIALLARLRALRAEAGREDLPFETLTLHAVGLSHDLDEVRRLEAAGLDGIVHLPFRAGLGRHSTAEQKCAYLDRFANDVIEPLG
jgi:alkanesulfonate monooxygenase SsuD/methylene tetrahydromethanopterin reductase-like flavin-dependent oxidoreductase (luciferase family)